MKKRIIIYIIGALVLIGGITTAVYFYQSNKTSDNTVKTEQKETKKTNEITYKGKNGITALALLKQNAEIITRGEGEAAFVTVINGVAANPKNQFWAFNVNGKAATVGAGSYVTKDSETITWKLSSF